MISDELSWVLDRAEASGFPGVLMWTRQLEINSFPEIGKCEGVEE